MATRQPNLVTSIRKTVKAMHWLTPADQASVDLLIRYAQQIEDAAKSDNSHERTKMLGWLGPNMLATLKALGGTPAERKALGVEIESVDALAELRARRRAI